MAFICIYLFFPSLLTDSFLNQVFTSTKSTKPIFFAQQLIAVLAIILIFSAIKVKDFKNPSTTIILATSVPSSLLLANSYLAFSLTTTDFQFFPLFASILFICPILIVAIKKIVRSMISRREYKTMYDDYQKEKPEELQVSTDSIYPEAVTGRYAAQPKAVEVAEEPLKKSFLGTKIAVTVFISICVTGILWCFSLNIPL